MARPLAQGIDHTQIPPPVEHASINEVFNVGNTVGLAALDLAILQLTLCPVRRTAGASDIVATVRVGEDIIGDCYTIVISYLDVYFFDILDRNRRIISGI